MPISNHPYSPSIDNYADRYASKYQSIAPESTSIQSSWKQNPGGGDSEKHYPVLANSRSRDLNAERHLAYSALNSRNPRAEVVEIKEPQDLNILAKPDSVNKFILTQDGKMVVGNIDKNAPPKWVSHPALAEIGAGLGQSEKIVSAGYLKKDLTGQIRLSSTSGHYLPRQSDMRPAQNHLRNIGVESTKGECVIT